MDHILGLERLRTEYMRSSGTDVADDLMLSILAKSLPKALQTHIQLQMTEHSTYAQVRELVLSYESVTTTWSAGRIHPALLLLLPKMALLLWRLTGLRQARRAKARESRKVKTLRFPKERLRVSLTKVRERANKMFQSHVRLPQVISVYIVVNMGISKETVGSCMGSPPMQRM